MKSEQLALPIDAKPSARVRFGRPAGVVAATAARWAMRLAVPLLVVAALLRLVPYRGSAGGVPFEVEGTLLLRPGLSVDTTVGNWEFPHVTALPLGVHVSPRDVDLVTLAAGATRDREAFVEELRSGVESQLPQIAAWLLGTVVVGLLIGLAVVAAVELASRQLRRLPPREGEARRQVRAVAVAFLAVVLVGTAGAATYDSRWSQESRTTGTLAALQLFPDQLASYYEQRSKFTDVIGGVASIQAQLQRTISQQGNHVPSFTVMTISDMHLATTYPLVRQYADNFDVALIVNTGDESEFGTRAEMTPAYLDQIRALTATRPMIWVAGNHDSPDTIDVMRSIPGVVVLGRKSAEGDGFVVTGERVDAFGLTIAGVPDPRVYGAAGVFGSDDEDVVTALQREAIGRALDGIDQDTVFDLFVTHEPVAARHARELLPGRIRQTNTGHTHVQNQPDELVRDGGIDLIEGTTGAGGLDNLDRAGLEPPPIAFSIETVAVDCQLTGVVRFQLGETPPTGADVLSTAGDKVLASTVYFPSAPIAPGRTCARSLGIGEVRDLVEPPRAGSGAG